MMSRAIGAWLQIIICAIPLAACVHAPQPDENYATAWGATLSLGPSCQRLEGEFSNKGKISRPDAQEPQQDILLSDLILTHDGDARYLFSKADTIVLNPEVSNTGRTSFAKLAIHDGAEQYVVPGLFCVEESFLLPAVARSSGAFPYVGIWGRQTNAFLIQATDGALIVKVEEEVTGFVLIVPYHHESPSQWARFERIQARRSSK